MPESVVSWLLDEMENHELGGAGLGLVGDSGLHTQFVVVGQGASPARQDARA